MPADQGGATGARTIIKPKSTVKAKAQPARRKARSSGSSRVSRSSGSSSARRVSSSSSSSRRRSSGGGGGGGGGTVRATAPTPKRSAAYYLAGDSTYQDALSGSKRARTDFESELGRRRGEATTQFNQTRQSMERDRTRQLDELRQEFASRGLIQSGLYGAEQGKFQQQFTDQATALQQQQAALLADLLSQSKNYGREQDMAMKVARQEALARAAAKFNLGA